MTKLTPYCVLNQFLKFTLKKYTPILRLEIHLPIFVVMINYSALFEARHHHMYGLIHFTEYKHSTF